MHNKHLIFFLVLSFFNHFVFSQSDCYVDDLQLRGSYKGKCKDGEAHGKGVAKGKHTYSGYFKYGKKEGKGKYSAPDKFTYKGAFKKDKRDGFGQLKANKKYIYKGLWKEGLRHGRGVCIWENKAKYDGNWAKDLREGYGIYTFRKETYKGKWKANRFHGEGKYIYEDKSSYEGFWKNGERYGYGVLTTPYGVVYKGGWKKNKKHGEGVYTHTIKKGKKIIERKYVGEWKEDKKEGQGKLTFSGTGKEPKFEYEGQWKDDKKEGFGIYVWDDGSKYTGEWYYDKREGRGEYIFASGTRYDGEWENDQMTGKGIRYYDGGKITKAGTWYNGAISEEKSINEVITYLSEHYRSKKDYIEEISDTVFFPPNLTIENVRFIDDYKNAQTYNNNQLDYNEKANIIFFLNNKGDGRASDIKIAVKEKNYIAGVKFKNEIIVGDLDAGLQREISIPVESSDDLKSGKAKFIINIYESRGFDITTEVNIATKGFMAPNLQITNPKINIENTKNNMITLEVKLENIGQGFAEDVKVNFQLPPNVFPVKKTFFSLGDFEKEKSETINFDFTYNNRYKEENIFVKCMVSEKLGRYGIEETFTIPVDKIKENSHIDIDNSSVINTTLSDVDKDLPKTNNNKPDAFAVVIGNRDYIHTQHVDYAINDAKSIIKYLIEVLGFKEGNIFYIENASKSDLETYFGVENNPVGKLYNSIKPEKSDVFIFYAGHGAPSLKNGKNYFVPVESDPNYIELNGYSIELFNKNLTKLSAKSITVVLDACFSGANVFSGISGFKPIPRKPSDLPNGILLSSSTGEQVSSWYNEKKHGMFTYFFLKAIHNKNADYNRDNKITFNELYQFISDKSEGIPYYARKLHGVEQDPTIEGKNIETIFIEY